MNDEAVNAICNTLLLIKSDIKELKQNYKILKDEHTQLKECFEHFKKQIETLSETISNPVNETIHENTEIVPMKTKKNKYITTTTMTAVFRVLLFIFSKAAVTLHIGVPF